MTNTGNVTLDPVVVSDPMTGLSDISCPDTSLGPLGSETCTATYTTTQGDVDQGSITNTGTATGTAPNGQEVTATSSTRASRPPEPAISLKKSADVDTPLLGPGHARHLLLQGDQHGQRHAGPGHGERPHARPSDLSCPDTSLAPGRARPAPPPTRRPRATWTHGSIANTGTATGTAPAGKT